MNRDRLIQLIAVAVLAGSTAAGGTLLPLMLDVSQKRALRYTNVAVDGAPPIVALGTAIGALRGIIVDWLWIRVNFMKEKGLYYDVMHDADLITKLQPRFANVWAFQGHNMAYNISVAHNTPQERWEWVKAGIDLVRNKGLRYNPNDLDLHRELAFWFTHKIERFADDAHFYYKTELAREWHTILGEPPYEHEARIAWIKAIADAPRTLDEAKRRTPGVEALVERLRSDLARYDEGPDFELSRRLLHMYTEWEAIKGQSTYATALGIEQRIRGVAETTQAEVRQQGEAPPQPEFLVFDAIASDPQFAEAWETLLAFVRRKVLRDDYNMDPQLMYQYTRDYGPLDWRHGEAHALYWALKGSAQGEDRVAVSEDDVYRIVNNDRLKLHAMQGLARWGRIDFDPFSTDLPSRLPDPRWIDVIDRYWEELSFKHRNTRGPGADMFMDFHQNFLSSSTREAYRSGEIARAQRYLDRLRELYPWQPRFAHSLDVFVKNETEKEYEFQPHLAPSEVAAALRYAYRVGLLEGDTERVERAMAFADWVTTFFRESRYNDFETKMGTKRLADLISTLQRSKVNVFGHLMVDPSVPLVDRLRIWNAASAFNDLRLEVFDGVAPHIARQFRADPLSQAATLESVFPPPPGLEAFRAARAARQQQQEQASEPSRIERRDE